MVLAGNETVYVPLSTRLVRCGSHTRSCRPSHPLLVCFDIFRAPPLPGDVKRFRDEPISFEYTPYVSISRIGPALPYRVNCRQTNVLNIILSAHILMLLTLDIKSFEGITQRSRREWNPSYLRSNSVSRTIGSPGFICFSACRSPNFQPVIRTARVTRN